MNDAEDAIAVCHSQWRAALAGNPIGDLIDVLRNLAALFLNKLSYRIGCAFAQTAAVEIDTAHSRMGAKGNEPRLMGRHFSSTQPVFFLGKDNDGPSLGGLVRQTRE